MTPRPRKIQARARAHAGVRICALGVAISLAACGGGGEEDGAAGTPAFTSTSPGTTSSAGTDTVTESLASFAVDSRLKLNAFGGVTLEAYPIALFKSGRALSDTAGMLYPAGLESHRAKFPAAWTQWRAKGEDVEILQSDASWKTITAVNVKPVAGTDVRLSGIYEALSVASSPSMSVIGSTQYTFTTAGAIGNGSYVVGSSANVGAISTTADKRGTYTLGGYRLSIAYENGTKEQHVAVVNKDLKFIFIDGALYSLK